MPEILLVGDAMLDLYRFCSPRENPEGLSIPAYRIVRKEIKPGGAANVAANLASLGADFGFVSVIGDDDNGRFLRAALDRLRIPCKMLIDPKRPTIVKERNYNDKTGEYMQRYDDEKTDYLEDNHVGGILNLVSRANPDVIVVSDYRKGVISKKLMDGLRATGKKVVVDAKPEHRDLYSGVFLIKPNAKEAREMVGLDDEIGAARKLSKDLDTRVLVTRGSKGIFYAGFGEEFNFPGHEVKCVDVTGAGDSVLATFAHYFAKKQEIRKCIELANKAGAISVQHSGCYHVKPEELESE